MTQCNEEDGKLGCKSAPNIYQRLSTREPRESHAENYHKGSRCVSQRRLEASERPATIFPSFLAFPSPLNTPETTSQHLPLPLPLSFFFTSPPYAPSLAHFPSFNTRSTHHSSPRLWPITNNSMTTSPNHLLISTHPLLPLR